MRIYYPSVFGIRQAFEWQVLCGFGSLNLKVETTQHTWEVMEIYSESRIHDDASFFAVLMLKVHLKDRR
jgi:hypothetical protein